MNTQDAERRRRRARETRPPPKGRQDSFQERCPHDTVVFSASSKKEAVHSTCRNLATRLQIGNAESRGSAMEALLALLQKDEKNVVMAVAQDIIPVLVSSGTAVVQENAIGCLCHLVSDSDSQKLLGVKEGGIECLKNFWDNECSNRSLEVVVELLMHLASYSLIAETLVKN